MLPSGDDVARAINKFLAATYARQLCGGASGGLSALVRQGRDSIDILDCTQFLCVFQSWHYRIIDFQGGNTSVSVLKNLFRPFFSLFLAFFVVCAIFGVF